MIIAITGTPGTGKTKVSKKLSKKLKYNLIELNDLIIKNKLHSGYDRKRKTYIVDIKKIKKMKFEDNTVVDSHLSHNLKVDKIFVLRCEPKELVKRLKKKKWNKAKVNENMEAELIGVVSYEARKRKIPVFEIDTTKKPVDKIVKQIIKLLKTKKSNKCIDWCK